MSYSFKRLSWGLSAPTFVTCSHYTHPCCATLTTSQHLLLQHSHPSLKHQQGCKLFSFTWNGLRPCVGKFHCGCGGLPEAEKISHLLLQILKQFSCSHTSLQRTVSRMFGCLKLRKFQILKHWCNCHVYLNILAQYRC